MVIKGFLRAATLILSILLLFFSTAILFAEEPINAFTAYPHALGAFIGDLSGYGLSYQQWFGRFGFETAFGGSYTPYSSEECSISPSVDILQYAIGIQGQYIVYSGNMIKSFADWLDASLYIFTGILHDGTIGKNCKVNPNYSDSNSSNESQYIEDPNAQPSFSPKLGTGLGIGIEIVLFKHFSFPIEFGLDSVWALGSIWPERAGYIVQGGFRYRY